MTVFSRIKGLADDFYRPWQFEEKVKPTDLETMVQVAHVLRGANSFINRKSHRQLTIREIELIKEFADFRAKPLALRTDGDIKRAHDLADIISTLSEDMGTDFVDPLIRSHSYKLTKPLYVARSDPPNENPNSNGLRSTHYVNPFETSSYNHHYFGLGDIAADPFTHNIYRLDPGMEVHHPAGLADRGEVVVPRQTLNQARKQPVVSYIDGIKKGVVPFGLAGLGLIAANDTKANTGDEPHEKKYKYDNWNDVESALQTIASVGHGAVLDTVGGISALGGMMQGQDLTDAVQNIEDVGNKAYMPTNERVPRAIGQTLGPMFGAYRDTMEGFGDEVADTTSSPGLGAIASVSPEIIGALFGLKGIGRAGKGLPKVKGAPGPDIADPSRRTFLKGAGLAGIAAATGPKALSGLLDAPVAAALPEIAGTTAATITPNAFRLATLARSFPEFDLPWLYKVFEEGTSGDLAVEDHYAAISNDSWNDFVEGHHGSIGKDDWRDMNVGLQMALEGYDAKDLADASRLLEDIKVNPSRKPVFDVPDNLKDRYDPAINQINPDWGLESLLNEVSSETRFGFDENLNLNDPFTMIDNMPSDNQVSYVSKLFEKAVERGEFKSEEFFDFVFDRQSGFGFEELDTNEYAQLPDPKSLSLENIGSLIPSSPIRIENPTPRNVFSTTSTGRPKWDELLASDKGSVEEMTPDKLMKLMAEGQGTTVDKAVAKRMAKGGQEKIDSLYEIMMKGDTQMNLPVLDYDEGGFVQDGYHRALAAKKMGLKTLPVGVLRRNK